jgi:YVTN family beta-propeller protein
MKSLSKVDLQKIRLNIGGLFAMCLLFSGAAFAQNGVVSSTLNGQQIALLHWYPAGMAAQFAVGTGPTALAFDGAHIWVANSTSNTLSKLDASTGSTVSTVATGFGPSGVVFDGASIWVSEFGSNGVLKLQASAGAVLGFFLTGNGQPRLAEARA